MADTTKMTEMRELGWDDEISREGGEFLLLPEGDYNFVVESYERARHPGSDKLPACNKAILHLRVTAPEGEIHLEHNLFLHQRTEGFLSEFFTSIGLKKPGEPLRMNWNQVPGCTGRLKLGVHTWRTKDGEERKSNQVKKFYQKAASNFTPGKF
jgi:hypothetical protein